MGGVMESSSKKEFYAVVLGALLHDIGRFVQLTKDNPAEKDHTTWGIEWFDSHFRDKLSSFSKEDLKTVRDAISDHHRESHYSIADAVAAGLSTISLEDEEGGVSTPKPLISIFSQISISEAQPPESYYKPIYLGKDGLEEAFPDPKYYKCIPQDYAPLLKDLEDELETIDSNSLSQGQIIDVIYFLLWKYAWCIPSSVKGTEQDVSLFDHIKTTAALAGCLWAYYQEHPGKQPDIADDAFYLVGGDVSGIQTYIFDVLTTK